MDLPEEALFIVKRLHKSGYKAYLCGGCVRDLLLQRTPKDYDIVTDAYPEAIGKLFKRTVDVGRRFGVMKVLINEKEFEVATFRRDGLYHDGRRPEKVNFSNEKEDAIRRDFTINGLFWNMNTSQIIDYVGGQKSLAKREIKTIGSPQTRFAEDYLRLMRAIRFACQLNFSIDNNTLAAIREMASRIRNISKERIRDELLKMLLSPDPAGAIETLKQTGLLREILPEIENSEYALSDTIDLLRKGAIFSSLEFSLATLLNGLTQKQLMTICKRLRLSHKSTDRVVAIVVQQKRFAEVQSMRIAALKRFLRHQFFGDILALHHLQCVVGKRNFDTYHYCLNALNEFSTKLTPPPLITGNDLIAQGFKPGPIFKKILDVVEERQLEGEVKNTQEALSLVTKEFRQWLLNGKG